MLVSVVVPVYNRKDVIAQCLRSLLNQTLPGDYEIIVVDDGSTDGTRDILKTFSSKVRVHRHPINLGVSAARNQGGLLSRGDFVVMTDSDCIVAPDWLAELVKPFALDEKIMIVGGKVEDAACANYWQRVNRSLSTFVDFQSGYVKQVIGCNLAFRREFIAQNPYDPRLRFAAGDDTELCWRCQSLGFKVYYTDRARVVHHHRASLQGSLIQNFLYGYVNSYTTIKYQEFPYINYGCRLILLIILLLIIGLLGFRPAYGGAGLGILLFFYLPWYHSARPKAKTLPEIILTYPGNFLLYMSFCVGSLVYFLIPKMLMNHRSGAFRFEDHPQPLKLADYQKAKERLSAHFEPNRDVLAIYSYGGMTHDKCYPGISDIDAIVLTPEIKHSRAQDFETFPNPTALDRSLFVHGLAYPATESALQHMKSYFYYPNAKIVCEKGKNIPIAEPTGDELQLAMITTILCGLPIWICRLAEYFDYRYLPIRQTIKTLSGERHMIDMMRVFGYADPEWDRFSNGISALREEWFGLNEDVRNERLVSLTEKGLEIHQQMAGSLGKFMSQQGFAKVLEDLPEDMVLEFNRNRFIVFSDRFFGENGAPLIKFSNLSRFMPVLLQPAVRLTEWPIVVLPRIMAAYPYIHAGFDTAFGKYLRGKLSPSVVVQAPAAPLAKTFKQQAQIYDPYWQFLVKHRIRYSCSIFLNQFLNDDNFRYESLSRSWRYFVRKTLSQINRQITSASMKAMLRNVPKGGGR